MTNPDKSNDTQKRIVFVVGAGASTEFGPFPFASQLALQIRERIDNDFAGSLDQIIERSKNMSLAGGRIARALGTITKKDVGAAYHLRGAILDHESIDDYVSEWSDRSDLVKLAKVAIADVLSNAEESSNLARMAVSDFDASQKTLIEFQNTWLGSLFRRAGRGRRRDVADRFSDLGFIVFNYDRCIEHFLFHAMHIRGPASPERSAAILKGIPIIHVYGSLGTMPELEASGLAFGAADIDLKLAANNIQTYSETVAKHSLEAIQTMVEGAEKIVFLGFGFHSQNLRILWGDHGPAEQKIWATAMRINPPRLGEIRSLLGADSRAVVLESTCATMMANHWADIFA